jgi:DNA-binding NarL/FixJ family response regulator
MQRPAPKPAIKVFIVEDYKLTRIGLRSLLNEEPDLEVIGEAEDAEKGLFLITEKRPDVVLTDLGLPGMDGIKATEAIKAFDESIKVVILTSHEREEEVIAALGAGANGYCLKDIDPTRLTQVIKDIAEGAAWLDPMIAATALRLFRSSEEMPAFLSALGKQTASTAASDAQPSPVAASAAASPAGNPHTTLTERELEVLRLMVEGKSNTEIAKDLILSTHTVKSHVCSILQKLYVNDRVQAAVKAIREGLI